MWTLVNNTYVLTAIGDVHVKRAAVAIALLKQHSTAGIVLLTSGSEVEVPHDQVIACNLDRKLSNDEASRYLKTSIPDQVSIGPGIYCYLDNDVLAVSPDIDHIFTRKCGPVTFASDHSATVENFSSSALIGVEATGDSLQKAISREFNVHVANNWRLWNGGVFLFDQSSREFLRDWHRYTVETFRFPDWAVRDQGTLVATAWKYGLQDLPRLPMNFTWRVSHSGQYADVLEYQSGRFAYQGDPVHFLHFIHKQYTWELAVALAPHGYAAQDFLLSESDNVPRTLKALRQHLRERFKAMKLKNRT